MAEEEETSHRPAAADFIAEPSPPREVPREKSEPRGERRSEGRDRRSRDRSRKRSRSRDRGDRDRDRGDRDRSSRKRSRRSRSRSRSRDRRRRRSRSRSPRRKRSRSRSRSRGGGGGGDKDGGRRGKDTPQRWFRKRQETLWDVKSSDMPAGLFGFTGGRLPVAAPGLISAPGGEQIPAGFPSQQAARQARRLYVGNIPFGVTESDLAAFFNQVMKQHGYAKEEGEPVIAVQNNLEKSYAFIEFRTPDEATNGMNLDGLLLAGTPLKIRRPKDYVAPVAMPMPMVAGASAHIPGVVGTTVPDGPNKIFLGGLPAYLNDEHVKELLQAFGELKSFNLVKDTATGNSKGFAFFEYVDQSVVDAATAGLTGMEIGGKTLLCQRANAGARAGGPMAAMMGGSAPASGAQPTRILQLMNMVTTEQLKDDEEFEDIKLDIEEECERYGKVKSLVIPRPQEGQEVPGEGKIFVEFLEVEAAHQAQLALAGRKFDNRTVVTSFFDEERYANRQF